jgi:hypothetical protein
MGKIGSNMEDMLIGILESESNPYIRQAAAFHEDASEDVLLKAIVDVDYMVRVYALHNQNANVRVFTAAIERARGEQPTQQTRQINELAEGLLAAQRRGGLGQQRGYWFTPTASEKERVDRVTDHFGLGILDREEIAKRFTKSEFVLEGHTYTVIYEKSLENDRGETESVKTMVEESLQNSSKRLESNNGITIVLLDSGSKTMYPAGYTFRNDLIGIRVSNNKRMNEGIGNTLVHEFNHAVRGYTPDDETGRTRDPKELSFSESLAGEGIAQAFEIGVLGHYRDMADARLKAKIDESRRIWDNLKKQDKAEILNTPWTKRAYEEFFGPGYAGEHNAKFKDGGDIPKQFGYYLAFSATLSYLAGKYPSSSGRFGVNWDEVDWNEVTHVASGVLTGRL